MISEVPLGAFLSGGGRLQRGGGDHGWALRRPGQHLLDRLRRPGLQRIRVRPDGCRPLQDAAFRRDRQSDDFDLIDTLAALYDEPYADSSAIPTYRVCQLARKHVTVACRATAATRTSAAIVATACT